MKTYLLGLLLIVGVLMTPSAHAQNPSILTPPNSNKTASRSSTSGDSDVVLKISRANGYYNLTVDGKSCKPVAESALIKDKKKPFPCDDNYSLQGYKYNGWLGGIWAYFEVFQIGSSDELADAEIEIGRWRSENSNKPEREGPPYY